MVERGNNFSDSKTNTLDPIRLPFEARSEDSQNNTTPQWNLLSLVSTNPSSRAESAGPETSVLSKATKPSESSEQFLVMAPLESPPEKSSHHHRHRHERHGDKPSDAKKDLKKELPAEANLRDGDIIFVSSSAFEEARAIQTVSKSPMTHCGVLFKEGNEWFVYEAVQPVQKTPLKDFHKTDGGETYAVRRLKDADTVLTKENLEKLHKSVKDQVGKDYDHLFGWGNDKMYCSELVWKAYYESTRQKVGQVKMVGDFDLSDPLVKKHVEARYGKNVPVTEPTITPGGIFDSRLLKTVR
jgi:hypothetical protein